MASESENIFRQEVSRLRAEYRSKRQRSSPFPPVGQPILDMEYMRGKTPFMRFWFDDGTELGQYVQLFHLPGTLSGDILRLERNLPQKQCHFEIKGDVIRTLEICPAHPLPIEDDFEDVTDLVAYLPLIEID